MARYVASRFFSMLLSLLVIITITFFLMHAVPGGPFASEKKLPQTIVKNLEKRYKLDQPLWKQYTDYLGNLLRWDLGPSFKYPARTVNQLINESFPVSAILGLVALALALSLGLLLGIIAALRQYQWQDNASMFFAVLGVSVPNYVLAAIFMYVFAVKLGWLPAARWGTPQQVIMPAVALAAHPMAVIARLMRSSMLEVIQQDYIRTARAKGLPERIVIYRHAIKNALIPVATYLGPLIAAIFTGVFVIEFIFAIPGLGEFFVTSISNRDYTTIMGVTVFYSILLLAANFLVDIAYVILDPRISYVEGRR